MAVDEPEHIGRQHYREYLYDMLRELAAIANRCGEDLTAQLLIVLVANADTFRPRADPATNYVDAPVETSRLASLLKLAANTARMIAKAGRGDLDRERVSQVAAGVDQLADELEELSHRGV